MTLLQVQGLFKRFGGLIAVHDVNFSVDQGMIQGLIGPNGAGKSVLFKTITGFHSPNQGKILFLGEEITGLGPSAIAEKRLVRTFQETTLFQEFTVFENVLMGCHIKARSNFFSALFRTDRKKQEEAEAKTLDIIEFMGLTKRKDQLALNLPLGSQRTLAVAVALAAEPELLLLDEPFAGMNPEETSHMMDLVKKIQNNGTTIFLVEHDMKAVMGLCEKIFVLNFGKLLANGSPEEIQANDQVIEAYLGVK